MRWPLCRKEFRAERSNLDLTESRRRSRESGSLITAVELVVSRLCAGGSYGQAGLGEAAVYEVAAVLDVP